MSTITVILVSIDSLEPNKWNANVVSPETFQNLKTEMKCAGNLSFWDEPHAAIVVSSYVNFYGKPSPNELVRFVIIDGYHRLKAAKELGWTEVGVEVTAQTEEQAQQYAYQVNKNRGTLNPIREAELFKLDVDNKMSAARIAEKYGAISESYVKSRLQLLKISPAVKQLYEKPVEAFRPAKETGEEPAEDLRQMAEVDEIVPRGTLTTSHLEAIASLPEEWQKKISLEIVEEDLNIRRTEEAVKEAKSKIKAHNRFVKALEEAIQKVCPECGSPPEDWQENPWMANRDSDEKNFRCSRRNCYTWWDPRVKAKGTPNRKLDAGEVAKREADLRAQRMKEGRENPAYILLEETSHELHKKTVPWLLAKIKEFTYVEKVEIRGRRGDDETVSLDYNPPSGLGGFGRYDLRFRVGVGLENVSDITSIPPSQVNAVEDFMLNIEEKVYKRASSIKSKVYLTQGNGTPELRARGRRFFVEVLRTGEDPFLPEDTQEREAAMEVYADTVPFQEVSEMERRDKGLICPRGLKELPARAYETCIEAVKKDCPAELQEICKGRSGKVDVDADPP